jgi:hypothetical protein
MINKRNKIKMEITQSWIRRHTRKSWIARDFVVAGLLFSGIISFFVLFFLSLGAEYDNPDLVNEEFSENYDKLTAISEKVDTMRLASTAGEGLSFLGTFDVAFQATFTVIQLVFSTLALVASIPGKMVVDFTFIDSIVLANFFVLGLAVITTILVFVWISSISRSKV